MSKTPDPVGDRCKALEMTEAGRKAMPGLPVLARLDGRAFHTFTRGLERPFSQGFMTCMIKTAESLVEEFHPTVAYTQSDEISLAWYVPAEAVASGSQLPFDGRFQKLASVLSGHASVIFSRLTQFYLPSKKHLVPIFDCRVWQVPSLTHAVEVFAWREADATKNSITMAASAYYSHKELQGVGSKQKQEMLFQKGVNWNDYPASFKRGSYLQRKKIEVELDEEERLAIPEPHRPPQGQKVIRSKVQTLDLPPLSKVENPEAVLFPPKEG